MVACHFLSYSVLNEVHLSEVSFSGWDGGGAQCVLRIKLIQSPYHADDIPDSARSLQLRQRVNGHFLQLLQVKTDS